MTDVDLEGAVARYMEAIKAPIPDKAHRNALQRRRRDRMNRVDYHDASDAALEVMRRARGILRVYTDSAILNAILEDWAKRHPAFEQATATDVRR